VFSTWDGGGNVPPVLELGNELLSRGHEVVVMGHPSQKAAVEHSGLVFEA
jgi:UDP:flavonoid glycosyltransferase YjiC (YdhE family)